MLWTFLRSFNFISFMASELMIFQKIFRKFSFSVAMATHQIYQFGQNW